jgi:hypothetical protein
MMFILIAWLLTLLTMDMWLRALHGMPIFTHTPLQVDTQRLQLQTLIRITRLLLSLALGLVVLHFTLPQESKDPVSQTAQLPTNASARGQNHSLGSPIGRPQQPGSSSAGAAAPEQQRRAEAASFPLHASLHSKKKAGTEKKNS